LPHTGRITSLPNHTFYARYSISNTYSLVMTYPASRWNILANLKSYSEWL
jgi:hypothetical protein